MQSLASNARAKWIKVVLYHPELLSTPAFAVCDMLDPGSRLLFLPSDGQFSDQVSLATGIDASYWVPHIQTPTGTSLADLLALSLLEGSPTEIRIGVQLSSLVFLPPLSISLFHYAFWDDLPQKGAVMRLTTHPEHLGFMLLGAS